MSEDGQDQADQDESFGGQKFCSIVVTKVYGEAGDSIRIGVQGNVDTPPTQTEIYGIMVSGIETLFAGNIMAAIQDSKRMVIPNASEIGALGVREGLRVRD